MDAIRPETQRGHEEPYAVQFSVFLANRVGQLRDMLDRCHSEEVDVLGLSIVDSTDWAVIRVIFSDPGKARHVLRANGMAFTDSQVLLVALDEDRAMAQLCTHLVRAEINIHFAYPLAVRHGGHPVMVMHVDDFLTARRLLTAHGFTLIGHEDLSDPT